MLQMIQRNVVLAGGVILAAIIGVRAAPFLVSERGDLGPSLLQSESPVAAVIAIVICLLLMTAVAVAVGRFINTAVGLFVLGAGLFVLDGRLDTVEALVFANAGVSPRWPLALLAIEAILFAILVLAAAVAVFHLAGPLDDIQPETPGEPQHPLWSAEAMKSAAMGAVAILAVVFVAQSPMKGQLIGAAFVGGMLAGVLGRLISPHVQPILLFASPIVFGAIGYVVAMFMVGQSLDAAFVAGDLPALAMPSPLDYAAGSLMGVSMGLGFARSFLHHEEHPATASVAG